jgi:hypothetical protein
MCPSANPAPKTKQPIHHLLTPYQSTVSQTADGDQPWFFGDRVAVEESNGDEA